jgi:proline iminopeptidase
MLDVGDGHRMYWEECGNPDGKAAVVLHGGPGSGCTPWQRRFFDPARYRAVLLDQRGCGRSTPHASEPDADLSANTTWHLVADIERLREHLRIDRWLVFGGSWGSALALTYAERHPDRVTQIVLWGVSPARRKDLDWIFRGGLAAVHPEGWERLRSSLPAEHRAGDIVDGYHLWLFHPDPEERARAAYEWCLWESAAASEQPTGELDERYGDPRFALAFARLVTHYVRHDEWLEDGVLIRDSDRLGDIPGVLVQGRSDYAPIDGVEALHRAWTRSELVMVEDAGHDLGDDRIVDEIVRATDQFAEASP